MTSRLRKELPENAKYCDKYDAYYRPRSGKWLENSCKDEKCKFCAKRPGKHKAHKWCHPSGKDYICK